MAMQYQIVPRFNRPDAVLVVATVVTDRSEIVVHRQEFVGKRSTQKACDYITKELKRASVRVPYKRGVRTQPMTIRDIATLEEITQ